MKKTTVYFDDSIALMDIFNAAISINCTLKGDGLGNLVVVKDKEIIESELLEKRGSDQLEIPAFLKPQAE